jgi:hypothetical protein
MSLSRPSILTIAGTIIGFTVSRASMITKIQTVELFGGVNPNAWLHPWVTDSLLGVLAPFMCYWVLKGKPSPMLWGVLAVYNAIGSMDYANGFITQWLHPQVDTGGLDPTFLSVFLATHSLMQLGVVYVLFRKDVINFFCYSDKKSK